MLFLPTFHCVELGPMAACLPCQARRQERCEWAGAVSTANFEKCIGVYQWDEVRKNISGTRSHMSNGHKIHEMEGGFEDQVANESGENIWEQTVKNLKLQ